MCVCVCAHVHGRAHTQTHGLYVYCMYIYITYIYIHICTHTCTSTFVFAQSHVNFLEKTSMGKTGGFIAKVCRLQGAFAKEAAELMQPVAKKSLI